MFSFLGSSAPQPEATPQQQQTAPVAVQTSPISTSKETITTEVSEQQPQRYVGQVKFFNDQTMYGFITQLDSKQDIFVHIRDLEPKICPSPTLFTGEYVTYAVAPNGVDKVGNVRIKAVQVRGIQDGSLMCDHGEIIYKSYSRYQFDGSQ